MTSTNHFQNSLQTFALDVASLGAVRHLAECGWTVDEIMDELAFPTPREIVRREVWETLVKNGVIRCTSPTGKTVLKQERFVREYGKYGKATFRKVVETVEVEEAPEDYVACDFGKYSEEELTERLARAGISGRDRDYILGLPWEKTTVYHRRDERMNRIEKKLREAESAAR